ncbi:TOM1-like protein 1 [Discoglossus pictus]
MAFGKSSKDPFSTPVGHLIEINTLSTVQTEDWGQFMNICDFINTTANGPRDALKAFKKRINKNYNHKELKLTFSLLEMCMQNCVPAFQSLVVKREFCKDVLVKMLNPKYNLPVQMQNKILHFIMTWSNGFQGTVDTSEVKEVYLELIKKGVRFPSLDANGEADLDIQETSVQSNTSLTSCTSGSSAVHLSPEQIGKIYSEMDMVKMNVKVMSEILLANIPGSENPEDLELLQELQKTCQEMQRRIVKLLETVQNVEVIVELVQVNDDLNNVFLRYERFSRTRANHQAEHMRQAQITEANNQPSAPSLIDLDYRSMEPEPHLPVNGFSAPVPVMAPEAAQVPAVIKAGVYCGKVGSCPRCQVTSGAIKRVKFCTSQHFDSSSVLETGHLIFLFFLVSDHVASVQPVPENLKPFIYPQMDLLELREAVNTPFSYTVQNQTPGVPQRQVYDNVPSTTTLLPAVPPLHPTLVPLQNDPANKPEANNNPESSKKNASSVYYELLEFDPLVETNGNHSVDAIYEEIDSSLWKTEAKKNSSC